MTTPTPTTATTAAKPIPTVDTSNFQNNAFSNFAPLLTLFGDEITKQFLSTSVGWSDNILLGLAPIGIMTIIVSAIRIQNNPILRSLIGRARDSPDDDEKEILSSTSSNVREIWDGTKVVRQIGEPKTKEYIYQPHPTPGISDNKVISDVYSGLLAERLFPYYFQSYRAQHDRVLRGHNTDEIKTKSPNLTLNIEGALPETKQVRLFMFVGLLIQLGVVVINGLVVYYWRWLRAGHIVSSYGYPLWTAGTFSLTIGVSLCAEVIRKSTVLYTIGPSFQAEISYNVFKIQRAIATSYIPDYLILQKKSNQKVHVSRRTWPPAPGIDPDITLSRNLLLLVCLGTSLSLFGFISQNIATRELHWSAGVFQLAATLMLIVIRGLLRRHIGDDPSPKPIRLDAEFKATQVAACLEEGSFVVVCDVVRSALIGIDPPDPFNTTDLCQKTPTRTYESYQKGGVGPDWDAACYKIHNMIKGRQELLKLYPSETNIIAVASAVSFAMHSVLEAILPQIIEPGEFRWRHFAMLMEATSLKLVPFDFIMPHYAPYSSPSFDAMRDIIEAIISFSVYSCQHTEFRYNPDWFFGINQILMSCEAEKLQYGLQKMGSIKEENGDSSGLIQITRDEVGELKEIETSNAPIPGLVLGLRYSSLFTENQKVPAKPTSSQIEIIRRLKTPRNTDIEVFIARMVGRDIFASFMLDLAIEKKSWLTTWIEKEGGDGLLELDNLLAASELCNAQEARWLILPALIYKGIL